MFASQVNINLDFSAHFFEVLMGSLITEGTDISKSNGPEERVFNDFCQFSILHPNVLLFVSILGDLLSGPNIMFGMNVSSVELASASGSVLLLPVYHFTC